MPGVYYIDWDIGMEGEDLEVGLGRWITLGFVLGIWRIDRIQDTEVRVYYGVKKELSERVDRGVRGFEYIEWIKTCITAKIQGL